MSLVAALSLCAASLAYANERADVQAELDAKSSSLAELSDRVKTSGDEIAELEDQISGMLDDINSQQAKRGKLQKRISALSKAMYMNGDQLNPLNIITSSDSLGDVLDQMEMRRKVLSEYLELSAEQGQVASELEVSYKQVSAQKDKQAQKLEKLRQEQEELSGAVMALQGRINELDAQERAVLEAAAEAERQAAAAAEAASQPVTSSPEPQEDTASAAAPEAANDDSAGNEKAEADADAKQSASSSSDSGWQSGVASAYGGSTDDTVNPDDPTATGDICDDYSMGVAVPMAWGPEEYYGRSVEITYNGNTVVATVNDCGGMGDGSRSLDLQPGVFKALGFDSCDDWGLREVEYRFL